VAIQPEPNSRLALLQHLGFLSGMAMGHDYQNKQVPTGSAAGSVPSGEADIALARGLHEVSVRLRSPASALRAPPSHVMRADTRR
jgi:hypothetical protein